MVILCKSARLVEYARAGSVVQTALGHVIRHSLTPVQTKETIAAGLRRNVHNCVNGWDECDRSKHSPKQTSCSEHKRNLSVCRNGEDTV
jgi:hypothetical protein